MRLVIVVHLVFYYVSCRLCVFTKQDIIAVLFCSTHKSLTLGKFRGLVVVAVTVVATVELPNVNIFVSIENINWQQSSFTWLL